MNMIAPKTLKKTVTKTAFLTSAALIALFAHSAAANTIGAVSALNQDVDGTPPEADRRLLSLGDGVFLNERIESSPIGSGQFLFLDQTTLTIARNSVLVLDRYVYDPDTRKGEFALSMSRGVLRFVGGRITKTNDAVITTPSATIGIRGGMSIIIVDEDGTTRVMHIAGDYTKVTSPNGDEIIINRSNGVVVSRANGDIEYVGVADRDFINNTSTALIGRGEAGERVEPRDPDVVDSGVPEANSARKGASSEQPISTRGEITRDTGTEDEEPTGFTRSEEEITTAIAIESFPNDQIGVLLPGVTGAASFSGSEVPGLVSGDGPGFVFDQVFEGSRIGVTADGESFIVPTSDGFFSFTPPDGASPLGGISGAGFFDGDAEFTFATFQNAEGLSGAFLTGTASAPIAPSIEGPRLARLYDISDDLFTGTGVAFTPGNLDGIRDVGQGELIVITGFGENPVGANARVLSTFLDINGTGTAQTSGFGVLTGNIEASEGGQPSFQDFYEGSFQTTGANGPTRVSTPVANAEDGNGNSAFGPNQQFFALTNNRDLGTDGPIPFALAPGLDDILFGSNNVASFDQTVVLQSAGNLSFSGGYAAGAVRNLVTNEVALGSSSTPTGFVGNVNGRQNVANAVISLDQTFVGALNLQAPGLNSLTVTYGGADGRSAALDNDRFAARQASGGAFLANGAPGGEISEDQAGQQTFRGQLATADLVGDGGIFPEGIAQTSSVLTWGWWGGEFVGTNAAIDNSDADQRIHLGAWVAGDLTASADLPGGGVVDYDGFAVISAVQDGIAFTDGAGYNLRYDFAEGLGTATLTDVLGSDATIAVSRDALGVGYNGIAGIEIEGQPGVIAVDGAFFTSPVRPADATGGALNFATNNGAVSGTGIFAADRTTGATNAD